MLVPLIVLYSRGRGQDERTWTPGAAMSTWPPDALTPPQEKGATWPLWSSAPTAMIDGQLAGRPTGLIEVGRLLYLLGRPAEALAHVRNPDLTPALASMVFVCRPPTATPTGRYLGCVHIQRLLREPPSDLVAGVLDTDLATLSPSASLGDVTRYFAAYNLVCGPVVDESDHLLGAVTVDDVLDHLLPDNWRETGLTHA